MRQMYIDIIPSQKYVHVPNDTPEYKGAMWPNPFPSIDALWQKEKFLKTSNFSFWHHVFHFSSVIRPSFLGILHILSG